MVQSWPRSEMGAVRQHVVVLSVAVAAAAAAVAPVFAAAAPPPVPATFSCQRE